MTGTAIVSALVEIIVSGISGVATGVGTGISTLATSIFLTGTGNDQTLSVFATLVAVFAAIGLGLHLCRWVLNFCSSLGKRNR